MANSRDLAEKAFTLLHDALRNSEARVAELDAELKRKKAPRSQVEERADVLAHRLESAEEESQRWQREAAQLEEILENERVKVAQLKKKLQVAESGPEKLTKKEINFWRQRAEVYDAETRDYKKRIAELKNELRDRDGFKEEFAAAKMFDSGDLELNAALEKAHREIEDLRAHLAHREDALSGHSQSANELESQTTSLRAELDGLRQALTETQAQKSELGNELERVRSELGQTQAELAASRRTASESDSARDGLAETLRDRETHIAEISAELERTRTELSAEVERVRNDLEHKGGEESSLRAEIDRLTQALAERDSELQELRGTQQAAEADRDELRVALADRERTYQELVAELESLRSAEDEHANERASLEEELSSAGRELEQLRAVAQEIEQLRAGREQLEAQLADVHGEAESRNREQRELVERMNGIISERDDKIVGLEARQQELEQERNQIRDQISGLEEELKEEKECTVNLSELANERRESIEQLEGKLEAAEERYEEAKWGLENAAHFERLVKKRKTLIKSLITEYKAKVKANTALKAGLDGLRTFKATSEQNQQKLLIRIEKLTADLRDAQESLGRYQGGTVSKDELLEATAKVTELEGRLATQVELIESLEGELKESKASRQSKDEQVEEIERLRAEVDSKNESILKLEADVDEQQKKLAKLRGSESETMRLKAAKEEDLSMIDSLQRENEKLKAALENLEREATAAVTADDAATANALKQKDGAIAELQRSMKEKDKEIARLNEAVAGWQKKYEFLSTEAPSAYQSVAEK